MSETEEDCGRRQRNGHTIELRGCMWRCRQCDHIFDAAVDADLFWCGEDCTGKHPGDTLAPAPTPDDAEGKG